MKAPPKTQPRKPHAASQAFQFPFPFRLPHRECQCQVLIQTPSHMPCRRLVIQIRVPIPALFLVSHPPPPDTFMYGLLFFQISRKCIRFGVCKIFPRDRGCSKTHDYIFRVYELVASCYHIFV